MKRNFKITIAYDGTDLKGWQFQPNVRTVQGDIEKELLKLFKGQKVTLIGSGRTDSGVHAYGQVANVILDTDWKNENIKNALNANLKNDIYIKDVVEIDESFHARFRAIERTYKYYIVSDYYPFQRDFAWYIKYNFNFDILSQCAALIIKNKNFESFCKANSEVENKQCSILKSNWIYDGFFYVYEIKGNRFLHHMVRFLVGTMLEVAKGKIPIEEFQKMLNNEKTNYKIFCAPSIGLFLQKVKY